MWRFWALLFCILAVSLGKTYKPALKDFPQGILQKHILQARHLPVCVVFRNQTGHGTFVEHTVKAIWSECFHEKIAPYCYWQLGAISTSQASNIGLAQPLSLFRCYFSPKRFMDYGGKGSSKRVLSWLETQVKVYENKLPEASLLAVENATLHNRYTLVGFASSTHHYSLENILAEVHEEFRSDLAVFFVHPHNDDIIELSTLCNVPGGSQLVFLAKRNHHQKCRIAHVLASIDITRHNIDVFLASRAIQALYINENNMDMLFEESRHYPPTLLCLYAWWAPDVLTYLRALQRTVEELIELDLNLRFAVLEVNSHTQHGISQHLDTTLAANVPTTLLLKTRWRHRTVIGIDQTALPGRLPTPGVLVEFLEAQGVQLVTTSGEQVAYQPWGRADPSKVSLLSEGPLGNMCYWSSHNQTESTPRAVRPPRPRLSRAKDNSTDVVSPQIKLAKDPLEEKLQRVGGVPIVTDDLWYDVIERSHVPTHPLYAGAEWRGEVTQVSLVIFIIADCASCEKHMELFGELHEKLRVVEGGRVYLVNCTHDPLSCSRHNVTGFPTLVAFRGLGWLHGGAACVQGRARSPYVQLTYHGVLRVDQVVRWFAEAAAPAVHNLQHEDPELEDSEGDVWLVASVLSRRSDYLHRARLAYRILFPYKCFRFACEQLYAHASCKVRYSPDVPRTEFTHGITAEDMVVTQVSLYRSDGMSTVITRLGEPLLETLDEEAENSVHLLHQGHNYPLPASNQRCEDNAAVCTDYLVSFTRDHARLSVNPITMATFHASESVLTGHSLPILIAFAHKENLTQDSRFSKTLTRVGRHLYRDLVTVTVDVDNFLNWANRFTPADYAERVLQGAEPWLFHYPRFCIVYWSDHHRAAFYPDPEEAPPARYKAHLLIDFAERFLANPDSLLLPTNHF